MTLPKSCDGITRYDVCDYHVLPMFCACVYTHTSCQWVLLVLVSHPKEWVTNPCQVAYKHGTLAVGFSRVDAKTGAHVNALGCPVGTDTSLHCLGHLIGLVAGWGGVCRQSQGGQSGQKKHCYSTVHQQWGHKGSNISKAANTKCIYKLTTVKQAQHV